MDGWVAGLAGYMAISAYLKLKSWLSIAENKKGLILALKLIMLLQPLIYSIMVGGVNHKRNRTKIK